MGAGASVSAEAELSTFKNMRSRFEALKAEGKSDEDICAELRTLYTENVQTTPNSTPSTAPASTDKTAKASIPPAAGLDAAPEKPPDTSLTVTPGSTDAPVDPVAEVAPTVTVSDSPRAPATAAEGGVEAAMQAADLRQTGAYSGAPSAEPVARV